MHLSAFPSIFTLNAMCFTVFIDFSLTLKAATLIFISGRDSAISSAKEGKSGFIFNLVEFRGYIFQKLLLALNFSCPNKKCFSSRIRIPVVTLLYEQLIHLT